jgi:hypothetical protein
MPARVERFPRLPGKPERDSPRQMLAPIVGGALLAAAVALIRRISRAARQPSVPPMSEQWLSSHRYDRNEY